MRFNVEYFSNFMEYSVFICETKQWPTPCSIFVHFRVNECSWRELSCWSLNTSAMTDGRSWREQKDELAEIKVCAFSLSHPPPSFWGFDMPDRTFHYFDQNTVDRCFIVKCIDRRILRLWNCETFGQAVFTFKVDEKMKKKLLFTLAFFHQIYSEYLIWLSVYESSSTNFEGLSKVLSKNI